MKRPPCKFCEPEQPAMYCAAQSEDEGETITWVFVCDNHIEGWNEQSDWYAPVFSLDFNNRLTHDIRADTKKPQNEQQKV